MPRTSSSLFHNLFFRHVAGRRTSSGTYLPFSSTHPNVFSRRFSTSELVSRSRNSIPSPAPVTLTVDGKAVKFTGDIESSAGHVVRFDLYLAQAVRLFVLTRRVRSLIRRASFPLARPMKELMSEFGWFR